MSTSSNGDVSLGDLDPVGAPCSRSDREARDVDAMSDRDALPRSFGCPTPRSTSASIVETRRIAEMNSSIQEATLSVEETVDRNTLRTAAMQGNSARSYDQTDLYMTQSLITWWTPQGRWFLFSTSFAFVFCLGCMSGMAALLVQGFRNAVNQEEQLDTSGSSLQEAGLNAAVGTDGVLRAPINDLGNASSTWGRPVAAARLESWSTLADLSGQSLHFLEHIQRISIVVSGRVEGYKIIGFRWFNASYMELETARGHDFVIARGKAYLRDASSRRIQHTSAPVGEPECGRRLADSSNSKPLVLSWENLVERYRQEAGVAIGRRLEMHDMAEMLSWFGALISSEVAEEAAEVQAWEAVRRSYCEFDATGLECEAFETSLDVQPPKLSSSGLMRFTVREETGTHNESFGDLMLLYIDLSDWANGKTPRQLRQKLAARVTVSAREPDDGGFPPWIDITEFVGSRAYRYELPHPAAWPELYGLSSAVVQDRGSALVAEILESDRWNQNKLGCQSESFIPDVGFVPDERNNPATLLAKFPERVHFNCDSGVFTWDIGGWQVETYANGTILALGAAGDTSTAAIRFLVEEVADGADAQMYPTLALGFLHGSVFGGCGMGTEMRDTSLRRLSVADWLSGQWADLQAELTGTNWCGVSTDEESIACPTLNNSQDYAADHACRRHDHCAHSKELIWGFVHRLACSCDRDLADASRHNWAVQAIYGSHGLSRIWGCYNRQFHRRWASRRRWVWHRETVFGETTRYGSGRYKGGLHEYGYRPKQKNCSGDLF